MHRLFVAIRPPLSVRQQLLEAMHGIEAARWQNDEQLHLTLRFIGDVETPRAEDIASALGQIDGPAPRLQVAGAGHFEKKGIPGQLWARIAPEPALDILQRRIEKACRAAGLQPETRNFVPHITLARLNRSSGPIGPWLSEHARLASDPWDAAHFLLYESQLSREGSAYEAVARYALS